MNNQDYKCKNVKPEHLLERLGFKENKGWWERKDEGFSQRHHCIIEGKWIRKIHKDRTLVSKGRKPTRHKAINAPEMITALSFMDNRFIFKSGELLNKHIIPSSIIKVGKMVKKILQK